MTEKKPDLSDLKARLGLNKPGAAPPPGATPPAGSPSVGPQGSSTPAPNVTPSQGLAAIPGAPQGPSSQGPVSGLPPGLGAPSQAQPTAPQAQAPPQAQIPPQAQAPPQGFGPPPGAAPPTAAPRPAPAPKKTVPVPAPSNLSADISIGNDIDAAPVFSKGTLVLFAICLVVGSVFGYAASTTMYTNEINSARSADAQKILDVVKPKVEAFREAIPKIAALSETAPDFEATKAIGTEFALDGSPLGGPRVLIGQAAIDSVMTYAIESQMLAAMLKEHERLTNADREEIEQLAKDNEILENQFFGVTFDYVHALKNGGEANYVPKEGRLVIGRGPVEGDSSKIKIELPGSGQESEVAIQGYIPIGKQQIMRSAGQNALTRYQSRVRQIKFQSQKIEKALEGVTASLQAVVEGA